MISQKGWTMVRLLTCIKIGCKKNNILVQCIDRLAINIVNIITEIFNCITYISSLIFVWSINDAWTVDHITRYTDWTVSRYSIDDSKIKTLFGIGWRFCWLLRSIAYWWLGKRWTGCCWACRPNFWGELKKLAAKIALKFNFCDLCKI